MKFSILLYINNNKDTLTSTLNSIKNQSENDFECIILDENSQDGSKDVYKAFSKKNNRFKFIESNYDRNTVDDKDKAGISELLNTGMQYSLGDYIVFCNGTSKLQKDYLEKIYNDFKKYQEIDIISYNRNFENESVKLYADTNTNTINELLKTGLPDFWCTSMKRKSCLKKLPWLFRQPFDQIFDTQFYLTAISHGLTLGWLFDTVNDCDNFDLDNLYNYNKKETEDLRIRYLQMFLPEHQNKDSNEFTVLVTFREENIEVEKTVIAIRLNDQNVNIQLVDDASNDSYNYKEISSTFGCDYIRNEISKGVAGARCIGVDTLKTPYFIIFDAHMRFQIRSRDFSKMFLKELKQDDKQILYANTYTINSNPAEDPLYRHYINEDCLDSKSGINGFVAVGAIYDLNNTERDWDAQWCYNYMSNADKLNQDLNAAIETVSILGATYAMSKSWWKHIIGLRNLYVWGSDEPWLSIKTYLLGGKCKLFKNFGIGHLYRKEPTYGTLASVDVQLNRLMIQFVLSKSDEEFNKYIELAKQNFNEFEASLIINNFEAHKLEYIQVRNWLTANAVRTVDELREYNKKPYINMYKN